MILQKMHMYNTTTHQLVRVLSKEAFDDMLRPENMTDPREIPAHQANH